jgi:hypothetical protein
LKLIVGVRIIDGISLWAMSYLIRSPSLGISRVGAAHPHSSSPLKKITIINNCLALRHIFNVEIFTRLAKHRMVLLYSYQLHQRTIADKAAFLRQDTHDWSEICQAHFFEGMGCASQCALLFPPEVLPTPNVIATDCQFERPVSIIPIR